MMMIFTYLLTYLINVFVRLYFLTMMTTTMRMILTYLLTYLLTYFLTYDHLLLPVDAGRCRHYGTVRQCVQDVDPRRLRRRVAARLLLHLSRSHVPSSGGAAPQRVADRRCQRGSVPDTLRQLELAPSQLCGQLETNLNYRWCWCCDER